MCPVAVNLGASYVGRKRTVCGWLGKLEFPVEDSAKTKCSIYIYILMSMREKILLSTGKTLLIDFMKNTYQECDIMGKINENRDSS